MKTISQIIEEYRNRQKKPQYTQMGIVADPGGQQWTFSNVTNFCKVYDEDGRWLEFDCEQNNVKEHIKIKGYLGRTFVTIDE